MSVSRKFVSFPWWVWVQDWRLFVTNCDVVERTGDSTLPSELKIKSLLLDCSILWCAKLMSIQTRIEIFMVQLFFCTIWCVIALIIYPEWHIAFIYLHNMTHIKADYDSPIVFSCATSEEEIRRNLRPWSISKHFFSSIKGRKNRKQQMKSISCAVIQVSILVRLHLLSVALCLSNEFVQGFLWSLSPFSCKRLEICCALKPKENTGRSTHDKNLCRVSSMSTS